MVESNGKVKFTVIPSGFASPTLNGRRRKGNLLECATFVALRVPKGFLGQITVNQCQFKNISTKKLSIVTILLYIIAIICTVVSIVLQYLK